MPADRLAEEFQLGDDSGCQETVSVDQPRISPHYHPEDFQELLVIGVGLKDHLASVSREMMWYRAPSNSRRSGLAMKAP